MNRDQSTISAMVLNDAVFSSQCVLPSFSQFRICVTLEPRTPRRSEVFMLLSSHPKQGIRHSFSDDSKPATLLLCLSRDAGPMRRCSRTSQNLSRTDSSSPAAGGRSVGSSPCSTLGGSGSTGSKRRHGADVSSLWHRHLTQRVLGLYGERLGEFSGRLCEPSRPRKSDEVFARHERCRRA